MMLQFVRKNRRENRLSHVCAFLVYALVMSLCGCATSHQKEKVKEVHERGWIGGEYRVVKSFPKALSPRPKTGLLLVALSTNTPAYAAGLRVGDVILEVDHEPIKRLLDFRRQIDARKPGTLIPIFALRNEKSLDCDVIVGRETFRRDGALSVGLPWFTGEWHPWPTRENLSVSLIFLGYESESEKRGELGSVKNSYLRECDPKHEVYDQDWRCWAAIVQVNKSENILKQEQVSK
jgi:hypothetical protein